MRLIGTQIRAENDLQFQRGREMLARWEMDDAPERLVSSSTCHLWCLISLIPPKWRWMEEDHHVFIYHFLMDDQFFTFIYEILFPASWKANVWISCSLVMSFSFDLGPFSGVWFLVSSLPFRFGQLLFILFYRYFIFRSFRSTKTFMGFLLCTLEPHVSSRLKYLWAINSFFEATLMARGETSIIWSSVFIYISDSFPQCDARISYVSLHGTCLCHISPWSVDIFCKGSFYLLDTSIMINFTSEAVLTKFSSLLFSSLNLEDYLFSAWWMISFFEDSQFFTSFREHCTPERSFYHPQTSVSFRSLRIKFIPQLFQMAFNARWNHAPFARRSTLLSCGCLLHSWKKIVPDNIKLWRFEESFQLLIEQFHLSWRVNAGFNGHCPNCHKIYSWINLHSSFKLGKSLFLTGALTKPLDSKLQVFLSPFLI